MNERVMLDQSNFCLTDEELIQLNVFVSSKAKERGELGGDPPDSVSVTFHFGPTGREVLAQFDGGKPHLIGDQK